MVIFCNLQYNSYKNEKNPQIFSKKRLKCSSECRHLLLASKTQSYFHWIQIRRSLVTLAIDFFVLNPLIVTVGIQNSLEIERNFFPFKCMSQTTSIPSSCISICTVVIMSCHQLKCTSEKYRMCVVRMWYVCIFSFLIQFMR